MNEDSENSNRKDKSRVKSETPRTSGENPRISIENQIINLFSYEAINDELFLSVPCPLCKATIGSPCVYVWPKGTPPCIGDPCIIHHDKQHDRISKVGTPTKIPHVSRRTTVFRRRSYQRRQEEIRKLAAWLMHYGDIFKE